MKKCLSIWANSIEEISKELKNELKVKPIILCIGNPLVLEDSLGPLVGTFLKENGYENFVYGGTKEPISSKNLKLAQNYVRSVHPSEKILVVDSSTTKIPSRIGKIVLTKNYEPFNPNLKETKLFADLFLFGVTSTFSVFPKMFFAKKAIVQKISKTLGLALLNI